MFDGQIGFPTPNAPPDETGCRVFIIPADEEYFALFMAAALTLTYEWNWFTNGELTTAEAAAAWAEIIEDAYTRAQLGTCLIDVPAPYWDESSADDADDQMPVETQIWYGEIVALPSFVTLDAELTFLDNLGIWLIAGFIAYAGQPGAAIAFVPLARKFVLAFKQHSLGGVVSVLVDFIHLADIDTYGVEDGVVNAIISIPDDGMGHTLYVEMSEDHNPAVTDPPNVQIIRKRLDETEVTPENLRWNVDCDCVQQTPDGGTTWVDSPTQDPRRSTIFQVPARSGGDAQCDSAQQMHDRVKHMLDAIIASSDVLQAINSFVAVVAVFFFEVGWVIEAIWAVVSFIFSIGTTTLAAALTDDQYALLLCILYCNIASDGTCSEAQFEEIQIEVTAGLNATAALAINSALSSIGWVGLTNAGALGEVTGDCTACTCLWCHGWNFKTASGSEFWTPDSGFGTWAVGVGWVSEAGGLILRTTFAPTTIREIAFSGNNFGGGGNFIAFNLGGVRQLTVSCGGGLPYECPFSVDVLCDEIILNPNCTGAAECYVFTTTIRGEGDSPFGTDNC